MNDDNHFDSLALQLASIARFQSLLSFSERSLHRISLDMTLRLLPRRHMHAGDARDVILEDIVTHCQRSSKKYFIIDGPVPTLQAFSSYSPLLLVLSVVMYSPGPADADIFRMFSSAPLLQDIAFSGYVAELDVARLSSN